MIKEILGIIFMLVLGFVGVKFSLKKLNKDKSKKEEEYEKEFSEGNIIMPIDKRDFENLDEFKDKTSHLNNIKETIENLDKDFENYEPIKECKKENENIR